MFALWLKCVQGKEEKNHLLYLGGYAQCVMFKNICKSKEKSFRKERRLPNDAVISFEILKTKKESI